MLQGAKRMSKRVLKVTKPVLVQTSADSAGTKTAVYHWIGQYYGSCGFFWFSTSQSLVNQVVQPSLNLIVFIEIIWIYRNTMKYPHQQQVPPVNQAWFARTPAHSVQFDHFHHGSSQQAMISRLTP